MKRIQIDEDLQQFLLSRGVELGESASSILRRELNIPPPPGSIEIDDDVYAFLVSRMQSIGESASSILHRELRLNGTQNPDPNPPPPQPGDGAGVVEFRIPAGTGNGAWNSQSTPVVAAVGSTLRIINDDNVPHEPHTAGRPFAHPANAIAPGGSANFPLIAAFDPVRDGPLSDHLNGPGAQFWINVRA